MFWNVWFDVETFGLMSKTSKRRFRLALYILSTLHLHVSQIESKTVASKLSEALERRTLFIAFFQIPLRKERKEGSEKDWLTFGLFEGLGALLWFWLSGERHDIWLGSTLTSQCTLPLIFRYRDTCKSTPSMKKILNQSTSTCGKMVMKECSMVNLLYISYNF